MLDEWGFNEDKKWLYEERAKVVVKNLEKRNVNAKYVSSRQEALSAVLEMIPEGATVVRGNSCTLEQIGIIPELKKRNQNKVLDPYEEDASGAWIVEWEEAERMRREAFFSDVFLTGTSAVTLDGKLVNIDGHGNRVAAIIFGPKKVIVVAGVNKIVKNVDEGLLRIQEVAAPIVARWHTTKHHLPYGDLPCVKTGICTDCNSDWRICRYITIVQGTMLRQKGRINVVLIGEELGI